MKFNMKQGKQSTNLTEEQLASVLNKQSKEFIQQDDILQKQITAALEREATTLNSNVTKQPQSVIKRFFQFQYTAVALTFVAIISSIIITNTIPTDKERNPQIVQIKPRLLKVESLDKIGNKIESESIAKMTHESEALKQDLKKLLLTFSLGRQTTVNSDKKT